jgi:hypothetical protein
VDSCGDDVLGVDAVQESEWCVSSVVAFPTATNDMAAALALIFIITVLMLGLLGVGDIEK